VRLEVVYLSCGCVYWRAPGVVNGSYYGPSCRRCGARNPRITGTEPRHIRPVPPPEPAPEPPTRCAGPDHYAPDGLTIHHGTRDACRQSCNARPRAW
jgi:hypothetical protein